MPDHFHERALSGRYVVERTLGRGGMATVYLARDLELERPVALKVLSESLASDSTLRDRFLREARLAAKLVHPNVVQVYDIGEDERGLSIVMEYVEGETLAAELARRGRLRPAESAAVVVQICAALQAAHSERLVHRDVKPQNILRRTDGVVKLADFGIARSLAATRHTELGTVLGTAAYLSPEQARGEPVTAATDLYSLGVVLYQLLTGALPFGAGSLSELVLRRELGELTAPGELAAMPPALNRLILDCLAPSPEDRPESAASVAHRLTAAVEEQRTAPLPPAPAEDPAELASFEMGTELGRRQYATPRARLLRALQHRSRAVGLLLALLALGGLLSGALAGSGGNRHSPTTGALRQVAASTASSQATHTTASRPAPGTPQQAVAEARAAIFEAETLGQLDRGSGDELMRRLDVIAHALEAGASADAAHTAGALLNRLADLVRSGRLGSANLGALDRPIGRLSELLSATAAAPVEHPGPPYPGLGGHEHGHSYRGEHGGG